jgi:SAM-dependent methyltransferase
MIMAGAPTRAATSVQRQHLPLDLLRCPISGKELVETTDGLLPAGTPGAAARAYPITDSGIPLFAGEFLSEAARVQEAHYERIAAAYLKNLQYPHTQEYTAYLDRALRDAIDGSCVDTTVEICCGRGEAFLLLGGSVRRGIGIDVSIAMLEAARNEHRNPNLSFVQGDATILPLAADSFDGVFMLGGVHHVDDRSRLFAEIARILKPGGRFYFREPVDDFALWRWIRHLIYRIAPALDADTERPLRYHDTVPLLEKTGLKVWRWNTHGFIGFCLFMNSDVLVFNRLFRFVPGIRTLTRWSTRLDGWLLGLPGLRRAGLQVVGVAQKTIR